MTRNFCLVEVVPLDSAPPAKRGMPRLQTLWYASLNLLPLYGLRHWSLPHCRIALISWHSYFIIESCTPGNVPIFFDHSLAWVLPWVCVLKVFKRPGETPAVVTRCFWSTAALVANWGKEFRRDWQGLETLKKCSGTTTFTILPLILYRYTWGGFLAILGLIGTSQFCDQDVEPKPVQQFHLCKNFNCWPQRKMEGAAELVLNGWWMIHHHSPWNPANFRTPTCANWLTLLTAFNAGQMTDVCYKDWGAGNL